MKRIILPLNEEEFETLPAIGNETIKIDDFYPEKIRLTKVIIGGEKLHTITLKGNVQPIIRKVYNAMRREISFRLFRVATEGKIVIYKGVKQYVEAHTVFTNDNNSHTFITTKSEIGQTLKELCISKIN